MKCLTNATYVIAALFFLYGCEKDEETKKITVTDVEGNVYNTVTIGNQTWLAENLKTTKYNDNTFIPNVTDTLAWRTLTTAAYSWYRNNVSNKDVYGALYNWFAIKRNKLCPSGWHVATDADFNNLEIFLGVPTTQIGLWGWRGTIQGAQLKSSSGWSNPGNSNTNKSGFSALPGGYRQGSHGTFNGLGVITIFWTSTDDSINYKPNVAWYRRLDGIENKIYKATTGKTAGQYVRCIKN